MRRRWRRTAGTAQWYRRAYFDDGTPLGSAAERRVPHRLHRAELERDLRRRTARSGRRRPCARSRSIWCARTRGCSCCSRRRSTRRRTIPATSRATCPACGRTARSTRHAALWSVLATALRGDGDRAFELYQMINPLTHARTPRGGGRPTRSSRTSWRPTSTPPPGSSAAAAGPGTPARRAGCTAWGWKRSWASRGAATRCTSDRASPPAWPSYTIDYRFGTSDATRITVLRPADVRRAGARGDGGRADAARRVHPPARRRRAPRGDRPAARGAAFSRISHLTVHTFSPSGFFRRDGGSPTGSSTIPALGGQDPQAHLEPGGAQFALLRGQEAL